MIKQVRWNTYYIIEGAKIHDIIDKIPFEGLNYAHDKISVMPNGRKNKGICLMM